MKIAISCICGASCNLADNENLVLNDDGQEDKLGDHYVIQRQARGWLEIHKQCYELAYDDLVPVGITIH